MLWYFIKYAITKETDLETPAKQWTKIFVFYKVSLMNDID